jgi:hypothetical protein
MAWPVSQDYNEAIQSPAANFADPDLRAGAAATNALGLPMPCSGNFADVYQVRCPDGSCWAVKCFTRQAAGLRERYQEISRYLGRAKLPFIVDFTYLDQGIRVGGQWYPVLKMQWVEGLTLNDFVRHHLDKPAMLESLLQIWSRMARHLRSAEVGHCDLQHGNVLLVPGAGAHSLALKLIDYDGMWVPALAGKRSGEVGHPCYQHPQRLREETYGIDVDRFPVLLVATALRALQANGKALWDKYDTGDNLLFTEATLREPGRAELFGELSRLDDRRVSDLTAALRKALDGSLKSTPLLESLLPAPARPPRQTAASPAAAARAAPATASDAFSDFSPDSLPSSSRPRAGKGGVPMGLLVGAVAALLLVFCVGGAAAVYWVTHQQPDPLAVGPTVPHTSPLAPTKPAKDSARPGDDPAKKDATKPPADKPNPDPKPPDPVDTKPVVKKPEPKPAVPDAALLDFAEKRMKTDHQAEYAKPGVVEMQKLARTLLKDGSDMSNKPADRFVFLREARDLAVKGTDLSIALRAADELARQFAVDGWEIKAAALERAAGPVANVLWYANVLGFALAVADEAAEENDYDAADRLLKVAKDCAAKAKQPSLTTLLQARVKEVAALRMAYKPVPAAVSTLAANPDDTDANLVVGKFYALAAGNWDRGLVALRPGSDAKLKALAESDLAVPVEAAEMDELGDRYAAQAEPETGAAKEHLLNRAYHWFLQAEAKSSGMESTQKVRKKRQDVERAVPFSRPVVLFARYGAYNGWLDVTNLIRSQVALALAQRMVLKVGVGAFGDDPAFGEHKSLVVVYRHRGAVHLSITGETDVAKVPPAPGPPDPPPGKPGPGQDLAVLRAAYGNEGSYADVTAKVQTAVKGATVDANPDQLGMPDVAFGRHKALIIVYRSEGRILLSITPQEATARLGAPPMKP